MSRLLAGRTLWLLLGLLALIEAIFLAESFTTLMEIVIGNGGTMLDTALLLVLKSPQIIDFALPLAVLVGLYFAIIGAREDNEFIVCAAAGVSWTQIPRFALKIGAIAFAVSIVFAGYLTPMARYSERLAIHALESRRALEEITTPEPKNSLRRIEQRTIIATPPTTPDAERGNLFIFEPDTGAGWRVSQADDWTVEGPDQKGAYSILMKSFRDYAGRRQDDANRDQGLRGQIQSTRMTVRSLALDFRLDSVISAVDDTRRRNERMLVSWTDIANAARGTSKAALVDRRLAQVLARALLCLFAALVAVAAAAWSGTPSGRFLALPAATVAVLGGDIAARAVLGDAAAAGAAQFWPVLGVVIAVGAAIPLVYVAWRREGMIAPGRSRG
ncbi:MAG: LptF/LptG family permease [Rhodobacter sp.]|nr:LptF/LptG family permease [Rhodobacter sp.]